MVPLRRQPRNFALNTRRPARAKRHPPAERGRGVSRRLRAEPEQRRVLVDVRPQRRASELRELRQHGVSRDGDHHRRHAGGRRARLPVDLHRGYRSFLWQPIPGVQTLNFRPYRVDLTPSRRLATARPHDRNQRLQRERLLPGHGEPAGLHRSACPAHEWRSAAATHSRQHPRQLSARSSTQTRAATSPVR